MKAINDGMPSDAKYGDVFGAIAQAQLDKALKADGIEIKSDAQSLPTMKDTAIFATVDAMYGIAQQDMLKPDSEGKHWVRVIPKPKRR